MLRPQALERGRSRRPSLSAVMALAGTLIVPAALALAAGASADPSIQDTRAQAQAVLAQVQELDAQVGDAAERWNGANYRLGQIDAQLATAQRDLTRARAGVQRSQAQAAIRLRQLYVDGAPAGALEVILGAASLEEVLDVLDASRRITEQDARIVTDLRAYRATVASRKAELTRARAAQQTVVRARAAERARIESKLAERKRLLASVQAEVQRLVEKERARQAELRRQAEQRLAQQRALAAATARRRVAAQAARDAQQAAAAAAAAATTADTTTETTADAEATPEPPAPPPADAGRGAQVVAIALRYLGTPYVWGGASPSGFDCSGLATYVFGQIGVALPHYAAAQYGMGSAVPKSDLQPGDLVFFRGLGHMGIAIGGGQFVHAPHTGDVVKISSLSDPYYVRTWVGARRVL